MSVWLLDFIIQIKQYIYNLLYHYPKMSSSCTSSLSYDSDDFYLEESSDMIRQFEQARPRSHARNLTDEEHFMQQMNLNLSGKKSGSFNETKVDEATRRLFVGDLSFFCTEKELITIFSPFGAISAVNIRRGAAGESLLYGFVTFTNVQSAMTAMTALNGKDFLGRKLR